MSLLERKIQFPTEKVTPGVYHHLFFACSKGNCWLFHKSESQVSETPFLSRGSCCSYQCISMYAVRDDFWTSVYAVRDISDLQPNLSFLARVLQHLCSYFRVQGSRVCCFYTNNHPGQSVTQSNANVLFQNFRTALPLNMN